MTQRKFQFKWRLATSWLRTQHPMKWSITGGIARPRGKRNFLTNPACRLCNTDWDWAAARLEGNTGRWCWRRKSWHKPRKQSKEPNQGTEQQRSRRERTAAQSTRSNKHMGNRMDGDMQRCVRGASQTSLPCVVYSEKIIFILRVGEQERLQPVARSLCIH